MHFFEWNAIVAYSTHAQRRLQFIIELVRIVTGDDNSIFETVTALAAKKVEKYRLSSKFARTKRLSRKGKDKLFKLVIVQIYHPVHANHFFF